MFGISPIGWIHTLGSLPAIPAAAYMFARYGRITPRSTAGRVYLVSMLVGSLTVFLVAKQPVSYAFGILTLIALALGYGAGWLPLSARPARYVETVALSVSALLLMVPTVTETLTRVPDGHPLAAGPTAPLVQGAQGLVFVVFLVGLTLQILALRRRAIAG